MRVKRTIVGLSVLAAIAASAWIGGICYTKFAYDKAVTKFLVSEGSGFDKNLIPGDKPFISDRFEIGSRKDSNFSSIGIIMENEYGLGEISSNIVFTQDFYEYLWWKDSTEHLLKRLLSDIRYDYSLWDRKGTLRIHSDEGSFENNGVKARWMPIELESSSLSSSWTGEVGAISIDDGVDVYKLAGAKFTGACGNRGCSELNSGFSAIGAVTPFDDGKLITEGIESGYKHVCGENRKCAIDFAFSAKKMTLQKDADKKAAFVIENPGVSVDARNVDFGAVYAACGIKDKSSNSFERLLLCITTDINKAGMLFKKGLEFEISYTAKADGGNIKGNIIYRIDADNPLKDPWDALILSSSITANLRFSKVAVNYMPALKEYEDLFKNWDPAASEMDDYRFDIKCDIEHCLVNGIDVMEDEVEEAK